MIPTLIITISTFAVLTSSILFFPNIRIKTVKIGTYWIVAAVCAIVLVAGGLVSFDSVVSGIMSDAEINPLKILVLFFSMTFLSVVLDEIGFFGYLAGKAAAVAKTRQTFLFFTLYALVSVLTVFTSNDIVVLTLTPFICFFCKRAKINPLPYLVGEFAAANTWSMMLVIGNPTNIYLATSARIGFVEYLKTMALPTLAAGVTEIAVIFLLFRRKLKEPIEATADEEKIGSVLELSVALAHLLVCLVFLVLSGYIGIPMWLVSAVCALSLAVFLIVISLIKRDGKGYLFSTLKRLPWELIPFVLSMFVIVICLNEQGVNALIGGFFGDNAPVWTYGGSSFVVCNLINNIPMSILFSSLPSSLSGTAFYQAIFATVIGSNVGAFLTPIGALAGIMFTGLTEKYEVDYGFKDFIKYGLIISVPTLLSALGVLALILH